VGQLFRVERWTQFKKSGKTRNTTFYGITSLSPHNADAARLLSLVRGHWSIENRLHWVRDVTFDEDRSHVRSGATPRVMAAIRNLAISMMRWRGEKNIAAGTRGFAPQPQEALRLVGAQI
jgi:predicted transposase YbfD/YdcC